MVPAPYSLLALRESESTVHMQKSALCQASPRLFAAACFVRSLALSSHHIAVSPADYLNTTFVLGVSGASWKVDIEPGPSPLHVAFAGSLNKLQHVLAACLLPSWEHLACSDISGSEQASESSGTMSLSLSTP
eukprot:TRINITY_DN102931_c0_g1_i1.p1 TRINITY_DN102931_c0_g1~~TRINITY_DN102931_c0_g1_i1.p1  ORF type:complete len:133 (+),score=18.84 TRINITY_DN102931_c0_g1_i1:32-430(+)